MPKMGASFSFGVKLFLFNLQSQGPFLERDCSVSKYNPWCYNRLIHNIGEIKKRLSCDWVILCVQSHSSRLAVDAQVWSKI